MGVMEDVQEQLGAIIKRPALKEKLLAKPPFRFLHDIVMAVQRETGFPKGLYTAEQEDSANVKEKPAKLDFLERLKKMCQAANGEEYAVKPIKVVAGMESENTCALLVGLAKAAKNVDNLDMPGLVAHVNNGAPLPGGGGGGDDGAAAAKEAEEKQAAAKEASAKKKAAEAAAAKEKEKAIAKPAAAASSGGGGKIDIEENPNGAFFEQTQAIFKNIIQKPRLSEKLLSKPPFRFLHDIVTNTMKATGFPKGLFEDSQLNSKSITDTQGKLKFLKRLIEGVSAACDINLSQKVNPKKIAAGLEPENTNLLLQHFGRAAASGMSMDKVLQKLASGGGSDSGRKSKVPSLQKGVEKELAMPQQSQAMETGRQTPKPQMPALPLQEISKKEEAEKSTYAPAAAPMQSSRDSKKQGGLARPKTARKAPPKVKTNLVEDKPNDEEATTAGNAVILDGDAPEEEDDDDEEDEEETLKGFEDPAVQDDGTHGKLVQDILKAQKKGAEDKKKNDAKQESKDGFQFARLKSSKKVQTNKLYSREHLNELRGNIQKICQSANPLGKIIDFVYEDMDQMNKELTKWKKSYGTYLDQFEDEKKKTSGILEPLQNNLKEVEATVEDQIRKIQQTRAQILRNDKQIQGLIETNSASSH